MQRRRAIRLLGLSIAAFTVVAFAAGLITGWQATREFEQRGWDMPARVYAAPLELYEGRALSAATLQNELRRLGYFSDAALTRQGSFSRGADTIRLRTRTFTDARGVHESRELNVRFTDDVIAEISDANGNAVLIGELDPLPIGSLFPTHGEDRIVLRPDEVPDLLIAALKAIEDRRFDSHIGIDLRSIARAAWVDLRAGALEQGASTLTQQLIRSYYLNTDKTFWRKIREAFMAIALELHTDKPEILVAYVNEVYLGQDGARAVHGFGLAAQHYFGKPLAELQTHELALLVGQVRGPSWYDPHRHPQRARERRDLVLGQLHAAGIIDESAMQTARSRDLDVIDRGRGGYYAGFLDLVRRELAALYPRSVLDSRGLQVFTTLDPAIQAAAEQAVATQLEALQPDRPLLEAAIVVTSLHDAEVRALVGGKAAGFNRALDAQRPIGSLIKPVVYLAALQSGRFTLASAIDDAAVEVELEDGSYWTPQNFDDTWHGRTTVARGLIDSLNGATVNLGMQTGVHATADLLQRLGYPERPPAYPSLLLGAVEMTPLQVAHIYNTLGNGGFSQAPGAVRAVIAADGTPLQRFGIELSQAAQPAHIFELNSALLEVMRSGTGKTVAAGLPNDMISAGKTGTSDQFRDSWFAGYTGTHMAVAWVGNDANAPTGLTGATGAGRIWASLMATMPTGSFAQQPPAGTQFAWIDLDTGLRTDPQCPRAAALAIDAQAMPARARSCGAQRAGLGARLRQAFENR